MSAFFFFSETEATMRLELYLLFILVSSADACWLLFRKESLTHIGMNLGGFWELMMDRETWPAVVHGVAELDKTEWLNWYIFYSEILVTSQGKVLEGAGHQRTDSGLCSETEGQLCGPWSTRSPSHCRCEVVSTRGFCVINSSEHQKGTCTSMGNHALTCASSPGQVRISPVSSPACGFSMDAKPGHPGASGCGPCVTSVHPTGPPIEGHPWDRRPGRDDWGILPHALFSQDDLELSTMFGDFFPTASHIRGQLAPSMMGKFWRARRIIVWIVNVGLPRWHQW